MNHILIIGGLGQESHDSIRRLSANRLAPGGRVIIKPVRGSFGYPAHSARPLIEETRQIVRSLAEETRISLQLIYVDYGDASTIAFKNCFFPFCLIHPVSPTFLHDAPSRRQKNECLNDLSDKIIAAALKLRSTSNLVSEHTNLPNLTPLLLPKLNFRASALTSLLITLYDDLATSLDPKILLRTELESFKRSCPPATPPGDNRCCFSDGALFFKSPGKDRHGYYRNAADHQHGETCLLNARSRLGGGYDHKFHFDCVACKGALASQYPNCHGAGVPPKATHVNVAPNDGIV